MSTKVKFFISGIILFLLFVFFSYLVHKDLFTQFDFNTTVRFQDHISRRFDGPFSFLSEVGKFEAMTIVLLVVSGFLLYRRKFLAVITSWGLFLGFHLIELYGKFFVNHPPPPHFMLRTEHLGNFPQFYVSSDFSYPSGHAGRTMFLSVILITLILSNKKFSPKVKLLLCSVIILYDLTMFVSRVYLGEHWSSDVIGGAMLGLAFGLIIGAFLTKENKHKLPQFKNS